MSEKTFDETVQDVLDRVTKPRRRSTPQVAAPLAGVDQVMVPTPHGRVAAWRVGPGPATVLVHGWQDESSLWSPLMTALAEAARSYIAFDLPAHGLSEGVRGLTFEAADALHAVASDLGPVDSLVAHSFASSPAALAVSEGLPITRMALIAPPLWPDSATIFHRTAERLGYPVEVAEAARAAYRATTTPERADYNVRRQLPDLDTELLLVSSLDDERMAVDDARSLAPLLRCGALYELRGLDHRETARDPRVIQRILEFIDGTELRLPNTTERTSDGDS